MRRVLWRALFVCVLPVSACKLEHRADAATNNVVRGDAVSINLPSEPGPLATALGVPPDSLRAAAEERYSRQSYDSAAAILRVEVARARQANDQPAEARARMWLGLAQWRLGDLKPARENGEASVTLKRKLGLDSELSRSFNALGLLAWHEGRYSDALAKFDSAVAAAKRNNDAPGIARALGNIPLVRVELGDFDSARVDFARALRAGRETDDDRVQGNALANLAMLEIRLGNGGKALPLLAEARQHYKKIDYGTGEANALGQLSTAWSELGDLQRAIASADSGLTIARAEGLQQEVAATLEVLADLYAQAGDLRHSLQILNTADSLDAAIGLTLEQGTNERRIAAILGELGDAGPAVTHARNALAVHRKVKARSEEVYDHIQLAYSLALAGDSSKARLEADSALKIGIELRNPAAMRDAAGLSAHLALTAGKPKDALAYLDRARSAQTVPDWRLEDLRGAALLDLGRLAEARREEEASLRALERERASLGFGPLRAGYLASRTAPFSHLIEIALALGDTASAFRTAASLPGRALSERIGGLNPMSRAGVIGVEREEKLRRISVLERDLDESIAAGDPPQKQRALERALESAKSAFEDQLNREADLPSHQAAMSTAPALEDSQRRLRPDEAMALVVSGPERLDIFTLTSHRVHHSFVPIGDRELATRVRFARGFISLSNAASAVPKPLGDLFDVLLKPVIAAGTLSGVRRLTIVTNGPTGALPFAALWNRTTGRFLVEDYVISYLPSVAALTGAAQAASAVRAPTVFVPLPDSLPGTKSEAQAITTTYPAALILIGKAATEQRFRSALRDGRAVHVASHGSHNAENPLFSRMVVGTRGSGASENDGRLEVHEILGMTTKSPLVFLSGCETALGSSGQGAFDHGSEEGSLAHAFMLAGASTVVATLWRINDADATRIAASFYRHTKTGSPPDEALALAQREALATRRSYTWAAYDVFGSRPAISEKTSVPH